MLLFNKDTEKDIVVIAEIGVNHTGSLDWILGMLPRIKNSGADAVKFQLFTPDLYTSKSNPERYKTVSKLALSKQNFLRIKTECDSIGLPVFATPLSHDWVQFVSETCKVIKIASGDFTFTPTTDLALNSPSTLILSCGATSEQEIVNFVEKAKKVRLGNRYAESIALLHCISAYPPPIDESNLSAINRLNKISGLTTGFSNHFVDDAPLYAAIGAGARILEIHVTDDRSRTDIRDHELSRTPVELENIIKNVHLLNLSLTSGKKAVQLSEFPMLSQIRKGIVYSKDLKPGHQISLDDLNYARPMNIGIKHISEIIGKVLNKPVLAFHTVTLEDFEIK